MDILHDEIEYEFTLRPDADPTLSHYVLDFRGKALLWDDEESTEKVVAEVRGYRLDLASASMDGLDQNLLLDSVCPEIAEFSETVFHEKGAHFLSRQADGSLRRMEYGGLVYINEITVDPSCRGKSVGTGLLGRIGQVIDVENCLIGLKAFPLADEPGKEKSKEYISKVKHFYEKFGFVHVGGEFMMKESSHCETMKKRMAWRQNHETGAYRHLVSQIH